MSISTIKKDRTEKMRNLLEQMRLEILEELDSENKDFDSLLSNKSCCGDAADIASIDMDNAILNNLSQHSLDNLKKIESALIRIREGHYGICLKCGKKIKRGRLQALPYAKFCMNCKRSFRKS